MLPSDIGNRVNFALLEIHEPKTRFTTARHQAARLDQPQLLLVLRMAFERLSPDQKLWPMSPQTMRTRFAELLAAKGLSGLPAGLSRGIDLGSLRAGGASWMLLTSEDWELTRRRGCWISNRIMEIYIQEILSLQFLPKLPERIKAQILSGAALFPWSLQEALDFYNASIPENVWYVLFKSEAVNDSHADRQSGTNENEKEQMNRAGGVAQHGLSVGPSTTFPQHEDKGCDLRSYVFSYIYIIYICENIIYMNKCVYIYGFICLFVYLFIYLFIYLFTLHI